jgi:hypothetical protein
MEGIEGIIYDTTRELHSVEHKINIASLFIFCYYYGSKEFARLLYGDAEKLIEELRLRLEDYEIKIELDLSQKNIKNAFEKTKEKVISKFDKDLFLFSIYNGDDYALAVLEIVERFSKFDQIVIHQQIKEIQLKLF